jgi:mannose-1-phosphate guanylyltransferase
MILLLMETTEPDLVGFSLQLPQLASVLVHLPYPKSKDSMKAFLLAAGQGTRLRPITNRVPKCLVPICGVPMLKIWMEICRKAGIDEVLVNLHTHGDSVRDWLSRNADGVHVRLSEEAALLGSAGTLSANRDWVASEDCFWIFYADVLTNVNLHRMLQFHRERQPAATLGLYQVPDPSRCGIVSFDEQMVVREFVEKPVKPNSQWAFSGVMVATPSLLDQIPDLRPVDLGFDVLPRLVGRMLAFPISDYLLDIGTLENYQRAQSTWPGFTA